MDAYAPLLMDHGLKGMIGKGLRSKQVVDSIIKNNAVYFAAIGGAGALLAEAIKEAEVIAFPDLGAEAIYKLRVENFPVTVIIDNEGNDLYKIGKEQYKK
jgi:fumarate hydratase subunit beta